MFPKPLTITLLTTTVLCRAIGQDLPPGIPNPLNPDGTLSDAFMFTTPAYGREAFRLILQEANQVAKELGLPEQLPICPSNVVKSYIVPFGYAYVKKSLGNITTQNYKYGVLESNKFSELIITHLDQRCLQYQKNYQLPVEQLDTNGAYRLATQWLAAVRVDVRALEKCQTEIKPNEFWNRIEPGGKLEKGTFVPIYDVHWTSPTAKDLGIVASVQIFSPTKTLLQMSVYEPQYILRPPLQFTNLSVLLTDPNRKRPRNLGAGR